MEQFATAIERSEEGERKVRRDTRACLIFVVVLLVLVSLCVVIVLFRRSLLHTLIFLSAIWIPSLAVIITAVINRRKRQLS